VIVADSNLIVYCWIRGARTEIAQRVRAADPDWQVPLLWRSEVRNSLAGFMRDGSISHARARALIRHIEGELAGAEHLPGSDAVLNVVERSRLSAYDAEFVALADGLGVPLVTEDKAIVRAFPALAMTMEAFLER
jgi:predicted nucleic acid-binding protein